MTPGEGWEGAVEALVRQAWLGLGAGDVGEALLHESVFL